MTGLDAIKSHCRKHGIAIRKEKADRANTRAGHIVYEIGQKGSPIGRIWVSIQHEDYVRHQSLFDDEHTHRTMNAIVFASQHDVGEAYSLD